MNHTQSTVALSVQNHYSNPNHMTTFIKRITVLTNEETAQVTLTAEFDKHLGYQVRIESSLLCHPAKTNTNSYKTTVKGLLLIFDRFAVYYIKQARAMYKSICVKEDTNTELIYDLG